LFDLAGARETVSTARDLNTPYAVVINAAPVKREDKEVPVVALSRAQVERLSVPVWSDRISQVSRHARWRCERRRKQQRWPPASWRLPGCGRRSTARSNAINGAQVDAVQSGLT
jgi:hypothetical protein